MKGVILSGGKGTRLRPLTYVTSKQLLPIYNKPMIYYPLQTLLDAGIKEIFIIVAPERAGDYLNLLGSGSKFGARFTYEVQDEPKGLAHGLSLAESFADDDSVAFILGDNILEDDLSGTIKNFSGKGAMNFGRKMTDVEKLKQLGVIETDDEGNVISIEEKPEKPKSDLGQVGFYLYDNKCFDYIRELKPSARGELEITDLNNVYLEKGLLKAEVLKGEWIDAGTFDSLLKANNFIANKYKNA